MARDSFLRAVAAAPSLRGAGRGTPLLLCGALLLGVPGCAQSQDYASPEKICGTKVDPDAIAPLLPKGTEVRSRQNASSREGATCTVEVVREDGAKYTQVMRIRRDAVPGGDDPLKVKEKRLDAYGDPRPADIGAEGRIADKGALAVKPCPRRGAETTFALQIDLYTATPAKVTERRTALKRFARGHFPLAFKDQGCGA